MSGRIKTALVMTALLGFASSSGYLISSTEEHSNPGQHRLQQAEVLQLAGMKRLYFPINQDAGQEGRFQTCSLT